MCVILNLFHAGTGCDKRQPVEAHSFEHTAAYIRNLVIYTDGASGELFGVVFQLISTLSIPTVICSGLRVKFSWVLSLGSNNDLCQ